MDMMKPVSLIMMMSQAMESMPMIMAKSGGNQEGERTKREDDEDDPLDW